MNKGLEMYLDFRRTLDLLCYPLLHTWSIDDGDYIKIEHENKFIGFMMIINGYVEAIYVEPAYRRKGLAKKTVVDYLHNGGNIQTLHIVKGNLPAIAFWNNIFDMHKINECPVDVLYQVDGLKEKSNEL